MALSLSDQCDLLGYNLRRNKEDVMGNVHKYATYPASGSGGINYFDTDADLQRWIQTVNSTRRVMYDGKTLLDFMLEKP